MLHSLQWYPETIILIVRCHVVSMTLQLFCLAMWANKSNPAGLLREREGELVGQRACKYCRELFGIIIIVYMYSFSAQTIHVRALSLGLSKTRHDKIGENRNLSCSQVSLPCMHVHVHVHVNPSS